MIDRFSENIVLHVGYAKTATTFLQRKIFRKIDGYLSLEHIPAKDFYEPIIYSDSSVYSKEDALKQLDIYLKSQKHRNLNNLDGLILSNERFQLLANDVGLVAMRLKDLFPNAKVIISLREQFDLLFSYFLFKGYVSNFDGLSARHRRMNEYVEINEFIQEGLRSKENHFIKRLDFFAFYRTYLNLFGENKVHLLFYEDIINTEFELLEFIKSILNCEINFPVNVQQKVNQRDRDKELLKHVSLYFNRQLIRQIKEKQVLKFVINLPFLFFNKNFSPIITNSTYFHFDEKTNGVVPKIETKNINNLRRMFSQTNRNLKLISKIEIQNKGYLI